MNLRRTIAPFCLIFLSPVIGVQAQINSPRTVMDTELGSIFQPAVGFPNSDFGAYMGAGKASTMFTPETIKGHYGHFNHVGPFDEQLGFPYSLLRTYESQQVAAGRSPIFVTATYEGKRRPVLFNAYLGLDRDDRPTTPSSSWMYAVNVQDDRFIKFWLNHYVRPAVLQPMNGLGNVWVYVDGCAFTYLAYGVLDDSGRFVGGVPWDSPFAQNANEYLDSIAYFFNRVKQLAPDLKIITDVGSMSDPTQFQKIYAHVEGALAEDVLAWYSSPTQSQRNGFYKQVFPWFSWLGATGRVGVMGALLPSDWQESELLAGFVVYELLKGPNFFFATRGAHVPSGAWKGWNAALGAPLAAFQEGPAHGEAANRLFSRRYQNGYVYLNWTGSTQTVTLPGGKWVDPHNHLVTKITIPNLTGTFVTTAGSSAVTAQAPAISPRCQYNMTGPATVTLSSSTANATIRYTLDGSTPDSSSSVYSGPFQLHSSRNVNARAFASGYNPSSSSTALIKVSVGAPTVQFATTSDTVPARGAGAVTTYYPVLALSAVPDETVTVRYKAVSPQGRVATGSVRFVPGEVYQQFPVSVSEAGIWTMEITGANGAITGAGRTFHLTEE